jgi:hypothetical protein
MTKQEAHAFLNAAQQGMRATRQEITRALYVTGDLGCMPEPAPAPVIEASSAWPYYANTTTDRNAA